MNHYIFAHTQYIDQRAILLQRIHEVFKNNMSSLLCYEVKCDYQTIPPIDLSFNKPLFHWYIEALYTNYSRYIRI